MNVTELFDVAAQSYDQMRRVYIPCFDEFYGMVAEILPFSRDDEFSVLDLGAGTGLLSALLAAQFPKARFTLLDGAPQMLKQAQERFAGDDRFEFVELDYTQGQISGRYDVCVSALSIHHVAPQQLGEVFRRIRDVLPYGGLFVNADQALGVTPQNEAFIQARWERQVRELGCSESDLNIAKERMKADQTASLEFQLQTLRDTGFDAVECWYKNGRFTVYSGNKR